eukprot:358690-Chlamydomonas_euryale.AAC.1
MCGGWKVAGPAPHRPPRPAPWGGVRGDYGRYVEGPTARDGVDSVASLTISEGQSMTATPGSCWGWVRAVSDVPCSDVIVQPAGDTGHVNRRIMAGVRKMCGLWVWSVLHGHHCAAVHAGVRLPASPPPPPLP